MAELVGPPGREVAPLLDDGLVHLAHQGGLADARGARDQHDPLLTVAHLGESLEHLLDLGVAPVQPLAHHEAVGGVLLARREGDDVPGGAQLLEAALQIALDAGGALVALLGGLDQQLEDHLPHRAGHLLAHAQGEKRALGDVVVDQLGRVRALEGGVAREQLVEDRPQRIEVGPVVDGPVHAPGLLGRDVAQGPFQGGGGHRLLLLALQARGDVEVDDAHTGEGGVDQDVGGRQILVHDTRLVDVAHRPQDPQHQRQQIGQRDRLAHQPGQRHPVVVGRHQEGAAAQRAQAVGPDHAVALYLAGDLELVAEAGQVGRAGVFAARALDREHATVDVARRPVHERAEALVDRVFEPQPGNLEHRLRHAAPCPGRLPTYRCPGRCCSALIERGRPSSFRGRGRGPRGSSRAPSPTACSPRMAGRCRRRCSS